MTCWTRRVAPAADKLAGEDGSWNETAQVLVVSGCLSSEQLVREWLDLISACGQWGVQVFAKDALNQLFDITTADAAGLVSQEVRLTVFKGCENGQFRFFSEMGYRNGLTDPEVENDAQEILVADDFEPFHTPACRFAPWGETEAKTESCLELSTEAIDARKLVRDATNENLPARLSFWLLEVAPACPSKIYEVWQQEAVKHLAALPGAELWPSDEGVKIVVSGPRKRTLAFDRGAIGEAALFGPLMAAMHWVCELKREAEIRHTLLVKRLATEWPSDDPAWSVGLPRVLSVALEGAKGDYKAHLHETTAETLKAMADLRKALNDEASKVVEFAKSLTSGLVRDLAIGLGAVGFRLLASAADGKDTIVSEALMLAVAVWFGASYWLTVSSNRRFLVVQARMRASWHRRIHAVLPSRDFAALVRIPLKEAIRAYDAIRRQVGWVYLVCAIGLVAMAVLLPTRSTTGAMPPVAGHAPTAAAAPPPAPKATTP